VPTAECVSCTFIFIKRQKGVRIDLRKVSAASSDDVYYLCHKIFYKPSIMIYTNIFAGFLFLPVLALVLCSILGSTHIPNNVLGDNMANNRLFSMIDQ
jgi:hypothetical protein